jgi:short-subunit dehydrogenase
MELEGAVCLVTGATSGIGRAAAMKLAGLGARVVSVGRDALSLDEIGRQTSGLAIQADLSDPADIDLAAQQALATFGRVDVLVNNAAQGWAGSFAQQDPEGADYLIRVNLIAPIRLARALLPRMIERRMGAIVNVASIAGHVGVKHEAVYASTKAGMLRFSESLRYELQGTGVTVSAVSPTAVRTQFFDRRGRPYGRSVPKQVGPERVAEAVVRAARSGSPQLYVPRWMAFPVWLRGAWPGLYRGLAGRFG